jgi:hypothetical protein
MRALLLVLTMSSAVGLAPQTGFLDGVCRVSELVAERPPDGSDAFAGTPRPTWYTNPKRTMWAQWMGKTYTGAYKVLWFRTQGTTIKVTGHRLDGAAPPMTADIGIGSPLTIQGSGLSFPSAGCWQIDASAATETITFVVKIL